MNNVLFEIGLEELPARFIDHAEKQLYEKTEQWLNKLRIKYESLSSFSTPRRLAVLIHGISEYQTSLKEEIRGPSKEIAQRKDGNWTKAAIGFTKSQGKTTDDIYIKKIKGTDYIFIEKFTEGKPTFDLLTTYKSVIESLQFQESMHWDSESLKYARPIRWLVALYNEQIIPFEIAHVKTTNITYGHRFLGSNIPLTNPLEYEESLTNNYVIANAKEREKCILEGIHDLEEKNNFQIFVDETLLREVRNLVEYPTVFCGTYEKDFLQLPSEVLITSMKEHQRYFPVQSNDGTLLPYFIGVRNGDNYEINTVIKGNEKVLHARLADGQFFFEEDQKQTLQHYLEQLSRVVFHDKLGTIDKKINRVVENTKQMGYALKLDEKTIRQSVRAAQICKFDLMTNMVNEFPELQGIMGEKYALQFSEEKNVAKAIREHYMPIKSDGELPNSILGALVSVADKIDTIVGVISIGLLPTGSQDPYSLRRQANGVLRIMQDMNWDIPLELLLEIAIKQYDSQNFTQTLMKDLDNFFKLRAAYLLREKGIEPDVIESVLQKEIGMIKYTLEKSILLSQKRNDQSFKTTQEALVRVLNLSKSDEQKREVNPALFETNSEKLLYECFQKVKNKYEEATKKREAKHALIYLSELAEPIHSFFDHNMVMADNKKIQENRLALVNSLSSLINDFADLSYIQWKQHS